MCVCIAYRRSKHNTRYKPYAGASNPTSEAPFKLRNAAENSYERTIVTARPCVAGSSIMAVARPDALTAQDALQQLHSYEDRGKGKAYTKLAFGRLREELAPYSKPRYLSHEHVQAF